MDFKKVDSTHRLVTVDLVVSCSKLSAKQSDSNDGVEDVDKHDGEVEVGLNVSNVRETGVAGLDRCKHRR